MKKKIIFITILLTIGLISLAMVHSKSDRESQTADQNESPPARVLSVPLETTHFFYSGFRENGTVRAVKKVELHSKINGRLEKMLVRQGDHVVEGQAIAVIEHDSIEASIASARAGIAMASAQLDSVRVALKDAERELARYEKLFKTGYCTEQELTQRRTAHETQKARLAVEQATIVKRRAALEEINIELEEATIRASINGIISNDYSRTPGEMVTGSTPIAELIDPGRLYVSVSVAEQDIYRIQPDMDVHITILEHDTEYPLTGKVWRIRPIVDEASRTTQVDVMVDTPALFRPGMFAGVFFVEHQLKDAVVLTEDAIHNDADGPYVWVAEGDRAKKSKVRMGPVNDGRVAIACELPPDTRILVSGTNNLKEGDKILDPGKG